MATSAAPKLASTGPATAKAAPKPATPKKAGAQGPHVVALNRKARFEFEVLETVECGLVLQGTEVKTLRSGRASIEEAWAKIQDDELWLIGAHIEEYTHGNRENHEPTRRRKLLLRRSEIRKLKAKTGQKGLTLVPLDLHFNERGYAKLTLALGRGKKLHDKRDTMKKREAAKEIRRAL